MRLIGLMCKHGDMFSLQILIGRTLFLSEIILRFLSPFHLCFIHCFSLPVHIAKRSHPFPFRTRQLSSFTTKILGWSRPGKLVLCRLLLTQKGTDFSAPFLCLWAISSVGQSPRLITGWSWVRVPDGPPYQHPNFDTKLGCVYFCQNHAFSGNSANPKRYTGFLQ